MNILITGAAGFIGSYLTNYLVDKYPSYNITVLDSLTYAGRLDNLSSSLNTIRFIGDDICNEQRVDRTMRNQHIVIHLAAESHVDRSIGNPNVFLETNIMGTHSLLKAAVNHGIQKFIHISTDEVFGELQLNTKGRFIEESRYQPRSPYAASKAASDHLVRAYGVTYDLPVVVTNCCNNYGPNQSIDKAIPLWITKALKGEPLPIYGDGLSVREWIHVSDHVLALDVILHRSETNESYLIGGGEEFSSKDLAEMIILYSDSASKIEYVKDRPGHDRRYSVSSAKMFRDFQWFPLVTFKDGLKDTIEWYKNNEEWWNDPD